MEAGADDHALKPPESLDWLRKYEQPLLAILGLMFWFFTRTSDPAPGELARWADDGGPCQ